MLEAVETYFTRQAAIEDAYKTGNETAQAQYNESQGLEDYDARNEAYRAHNSTRAALCAVREAELHAAWTALRLSGDKLIAYIAETYEHSRRSYAEDVLRALPMTTAELRVFGAERGWCEWPTHVRKAIKAGATPDDLSPARRVLDDWLTSNVFASSTQWVHEMVDRIADAEALERVARMQAEAEATADEAAAEAEAQDATDDGGEDDVMADAAQPAF